MSKPDANEQLKQLIREEVKAAMPGKKGAFAPGYTPIHKRGYHYFEVPSGAHYAHVILVGGGGGSGGAGSGGTSHNSVSGGGGAGGSGSGDGEVFPHPDENVGDSHWKIDLSNYQPLETANGQQLVRHFGVYVGRGGDGGEGGKAVAGNTGNTGAAGAAGTDGRPTFVFGLPQGPIPNHSDGYLVAPSTVTALPEYATLSHTTAELTIPPQTSAGQTHVVPFAYAHGGYGGPGGAGGKPVYAGSAGSGLGGDAAAGVSGFYAFSSGSGGGGGSIVAAAGGAAGSPVPFASAYAFGHAGHGTTGQSGNVSGAFSGDGGDGGRSNTHALDKKYRTTGWGGYGHSDDGDGIDFEGDVDPEPLESSDSDCCESSEDNMNLALGGAGGAGAGRVDAWGRNGASTAFPKKEICDCVEITRPADGKCGGPRLKHGDKGFVPGSGVGGGSGGSGMFLQEHDGSYEKSGKGGNGCRGCDGAAYICIVDVNGSPISFTPIYIAKVQEE